MRFHLVSLFPEFFDSPLATGLMAKARQAGVVAVDFVNPRQFAPDRRGTVDDSPYGGGPGMVMKVEPLAKALGSLQRPGRILALTPRGRPLDQALVAELAAGGGDITLVCGRYEGMDERLFALFPVEPVSLGDFVLAGGEAAALCLVEAVARLRPGFMGKDESGRDESFSTGLLEYPHYTRPERYADLAVPAVLLGGDHARIATWRRGKALECTLARRPELLAEAGLTTAEMAQVAGLDRKRVSRNLYLALVHYPVLNKNGQRLTVSLTNLDIHDMSRVSRSYELGGAYVLTPIQDQRRLARTLLDHWLAGPGGTANPDRARALETVTVLEGLEQAVEHVAARAGRAPCLAVTSARPDSGRGLMCGPAALRRRLADQPVLLAFGTGHGLAPEVLRAADMRLSPLRPFGGFNHLSVRAALAVTVDRILGDTW